MSVEGLICPNCGGKIIFDNNSDIGICNNCGGNFKYTPEKMKVIIDIDNEINNLLKVGFDKLYYDRNDARKIFDQIIKTKYDCGEAYLGMLLIDANVTSFDGLATTTFVYEESPMYSRALHYLNEEDKNALISISKTHEAYLAEMHNQRIKQKQEDYEKNMLRDFYNSLKLSFSFGNFDFVDFEPTRDEIKKHNIEIKEKIGKIIEKTYELPDEAIDVMDDDIVEKIAYWIRLLEDSDLFGNDEYHESSDSRGSLFGETEAPIINDECSSEDNIEENDTEIDLHMLSKELYKIDRFSYDKTLEKSNVVYKEMNSEIESSRFYDSDYDMRCFEKILKREYKKEAEKYGIFPSKKKTAIKEKYNSMILDLKKDLTKYVIAIYNRRFNVSYASYLKSEGEKKNAAFTAFKYKKERKNEMERAKQKIAELKTRYKEAIKAIKNGIMPVDFISR